MAFGSRTVAQYDVGFNVLLGPFRAQLGEAAGIYGRTTGQMSTESLRLSTRQADLAKAIQTYGAESVQAARKTVVLREEMERLAAAQTRSVAASATASRGLLSEERAAGRFARGGFVGSGVGRSGLLFGSGAFVGGLAAVSGLKTVLDAAKQNEVAQAQLQVALHNSGLAWAANKGHIDEATGALTKLGFKEDETTAVIAANVRRFGDVNQALKATSIEADVARAKGISLADAQNIVQRASLGQSRSLLALGIIYTKSTANVDALKAETKHYSAEALAAAKAADAQANRIGALDAVNAKFHGNAAKFATTSAGKQLIFNSELNKTERIIGTALLPEFDRLITHFANYLDKLNRTGRLQHDVNTAVHDFGIAAHIAARIVHDLDDVTGSFKHTLEGLLALGVASKLSKLSLGFKTLAGSEGIGAADVAAGGLLARLTQLKLFGPIAIAITVDEVVKHGFKGLGEDVSHGILDGLNAIPKFFQPPAGLKHFFDPNYNDRGQYVGPGSRQDGSLAKAPGLSLHEILTGGSRTTARPRLDPARPGRPGPLVLGLTEAQLTPLYLAEGPHGSQGAVEAALTNQLDILTRLAGQKGLNPAQRNSILQQLDSVYSQLQGFATKATAAGKKAEEAKKKAAAAAAKALTGDLRHRESVLQTAVKAAMLTSSTSDDVAALKRLEAFYTKEAKDPRLERAMRDTYKAKAVAEKLILQKLEHGAKGSGAADIREFLQEFTNVVGNYSINVGNNPDTRAGKDASPSTVVNVHQHFPHPPTRTANREAIFAYHAARAAFD